MNFRQRHTVLRSELAEGHLLLREYCRGARYADCGRVPRPTKSASSALSRKRQKRETGFASVQTAAVADIEGEQAEYGPSSLELNNARFHPINLHGCEFLLAASPDGLLDLRDVFVRDLETDIYARPSTEGDLPEKPTRFLEMEWAEEYSGDTLLQKEGWRKVHKVFLIPIVQEDPYRLNIEEVYSVDDADRVVKKEEVQRATKETDPTLITLCIGRDGLVIEENSEMIDDWDLVEQHLAEEERTRIDRAEAAMDVSEDVVFDTELGMPRDPIDALNDDEREYDESFEDTPEVDQGY